MNNILENGRMAFGGISWEEEEKVYKENYNDFYLEDFEFNEVANRLETYLIVGRRGAGKSSLAFSLLNDEKYKHKKFIFEERVFLEVIKKIKELEMDSIAEMEDIWEGVIWSLIFTILENKIEIKFSDKIRESSEKPLLKFFRNLSRDLVSKFFNVKDDTFQLFCNLFEQDISELKDKITGYTFQNPIIIAFDSLDDLDISDSRVANVMAALIQFVSKFNLEYAHLGIHIKIFVSAEASTTLGEYHIQNYLKHFKDPLFLHWSYKKLLRLLCYKHYKYLEFTGGLSSSQRNIDITDYDHLKKYVWDPLFGETVFNLNGIKENSFMYVLRHSQSRPRQLIFLCNEIYKNHLNYIKNKRGAAAGIQIKNEIIVETIRKMEDELVKEIDNSFKKIYPNSSKIRSSLNGIDKIFQAKELDKRAKESKPFWSSEKYSLENFRRVLIELGIVGQITDLASVNTNYVGARFEYSFEGKLNINPNENCVIHPMFYTSLNVNLNHDKTVIIPITDEIVLE